MADQTFDCIYDLVLPYLPGAETPIVDNQIRKTVREFMKRTTMFRETFQFTTAPGIADYKLLPANNQQQVAAVMAVYPDGHRNPLPASTEESRHPTDMAQPTKWFAQIPDVLSFYPTPDAEYLMTVNASLTLRQDALMFPEELCQIYGEAISAGVLATMMAMPGKPWTQQQTAKESGRIFAGVIRTERGRLRDGGQPNQSTFTSIAKFGC